MTETSPQACDLLIEAGWVVPVVPHGVVLEDHAVAVDAGKIIALLPNAEARARFQPRETVRRPDAALIPGLVNAHVHNPMTLLRGVADDLARVMDVPREQIRVIYNPVVTAELRGKAQAPLTHPWFAPGQPPVVLGVGRLQPQKDFPTLIEAFSQARGGRDARLLTVGEMPGVTPAQARLFTDAARREVHRQRLSDGVDCRLGRAVTVVAA